MTTAEQLDMNGGQAAIDVLAVRNGILATKNAHVKNDVLVVKVNRQGTITLLALVHNSQATSDEIAVNKSNQFTRDALAVVAISNHLSNSCN